MYVKERNTSLPLSSLRTSTLRWRATVLPHICVFLMQQVPGLQSAWLLHPKHEQSLKAGEGTRGKENNMNNAIGEAEGKGPAIDV